MLTALRGSTGGIVAKTFLVLLAGSFAVWGVADVFNGSRDVTLAKVGEREIGATEFRNYFDQRLQLLGRQSGRVLTVEQARKLGLDRQILGDLLRSTALDEHARKLKMSLSNDYVVKRVTKNKAFQDQSGNFDPNQLRYRLQNAGLSEDQFIANERANMIRRTTTSAISDGFNVPKTLLELVIRQSTEKRDANFFTIDGTGIKIAEPDDAALKKFYEANKARFATQERRILEIVWVNAEQLGKDAKISEQTLKDAYERERPKFGTPEMRTIEQIPFANEEEAKAALKKISDGATFEQIATEKKFTAKDRLLGEFSKADVPDTKIGEAAFKLKEGEISGIVKGQLSIFLIRVTKIKPESVKSFNEVRDQLTKELKIAAGRDVILNVRDKVEDERGAGTSFKEIAKSQSLSFFKTNPINKSGLDKDGKAVENVPDWPRVLQAANNAQAGIEIDPISTKDDGFVWVNVAEVIPVQTPPIKEVRAKAVKLWKAAELSKALEAKAKALLKEANNGAKLDALAKKSNATIEKELGISRRTASQKFDTQAVQALFRVAPDGFAYSLRADGKAAIIMQSSPVLSPPIDTTTKENKAVAARLKELIGNDIFASYLVDLQKQVGVEIKPKGWTRVFQTSSR